MNGVLESIKLALWGTPLLVLLIGVGCYLTIILRGVQFRYLWRSLKLMFKSDQENAKGDISPFQSLMTSMASAVGTGSIVGMATAITIGGMGVVFWLWIMAFISMAIKYAESLLAVKYRVVDSDGSMSGGPMYYIERGLGWKPLAMAFAAFASIAAIGTGNLVQVNSIADAMQNACGMPPFVTGLIVTLISCSILFGGIKSIGKVSGWLVPFMAGFYIVAGIIVILCHMENLPDTISLIFRSAFTGQAAFGAFMGSTMGMAVQMGIARCAFCSEAGLGIASIASAAAKTSSSGRQAMMSMTGTLLSISLICTITAFVIGVTNSLGKVGPNGTVLNGASLVIESFSDVLSVGKFIVIIGLVLFALTTMIAWAYYGEKCFEYLFGINSIKAYRTVYVALIMPGSIFALEVVWNFADIMNALMVIPNMIALLGLSGVIQKETKEFIASERAPEPSLGSTANTPTPSSI